MRINTITKEQLEELESFGYDLELPSIDEIIDYLRERYNIVIYNKMAPFVSPTSKKIVYCFEVKWCNLRDGWNGREVIGHSEYTHDIYDAKRQAINLALAYLKQRQQGK